MRVETRLMPRMQRPSSSQLATTAAIAAAILFAGGIVAGVVSAIEENLGGTLLSMLLWFLAPIAAIVWLIGFITSRADRRSRSGSGFDVIRKP
jgi:hypothetical protein